MACPVYMSYGMSYYEFWHGDPWLAWYYKKAYIERRKAENYRDWLLGAYYYNAVSTAIENGFSKKGSKRRDYLSEPFQIFPLTKEEREAKERAERERGMMALREIARKQRADMARERQKNGQTNNLGTGDHPVNQGLDSKD